MHRVLCQRRFPFRRSEPERAHEGGERRRGHRGHVEVEQGGRGGWAGLSVGIGGGERGNCRGCLGGARVVDDRVIEQV